MKRDDVIQTVEEIIGKDVLQQARSMDDMANGVQLLGSADVKSIAVGVSINDAFLSAAADSGATLVITHHGLDFRTYKSSLPTYTQKRLKTAIRKHITVMGFHAALDIHPQIGNNAIISNKLGAEMTSSLFDSWGFVASLKEPMNIAEILMKCQTLFNHEVLYVPSGERTEVQTLGIVSGAGKPASHHIAEMEEKGVELFITGEASESVPHKLIECGIDYFVCGHYATEVFGVQVLADELNKRIGSDVDVRFIDIPNQI